MLQTLLLSSVSIAFFGFLANKFYFSGTRCKSKTQLHDKTVIVTGANCGIGYETALDLAKRGSRVIIACRDRIKGEQAVKELIKNSKNEKIELEILDLASLKSIEEFCARIKAKCKRIDILVNNAGLTIYDQVYRKTQDGFEISFGVNHLGPFYLTNLLLDLIISSAPSRIVNVSSTGHTLVKGMKWDDLNHEKGYSSLIAYCQSKLANILFTRELAGRLDGTGVTTVCLHPGFVRTEIFRNLSGIQLVIAVLGRPIIWMISKNCWEGAQTSIHCAVADDVNEHNGEYYSDCRPIQTSPAGRDDEEAKKLWDVSAKLVGLK